MEFSVIVPVHNGRETLHDCLTALVRQDYDSDRYEVIVVNDGSADETSEIAHRFPVRVIDLPENRGRLAARKVGAISAKYDVLVFNDVRVIPGQDLLSGIANRGYLPLIPDVVDHDGSLTGFSRLFHLLRRRFYHPYYPVHTESEEILIDVANFDRVPKGTTCLACTKSVWLACQPERAGKHVNDDTRVLRCMIEARPILRTSRIRVRYMQRTGFWSVLCHVYGRGPRFAEYYTVRGARYHRWYLASWVALVLVVGLVFSFWSVFPWLLMVCLVTAVVLAAWLSEGVCDFLVVLLLLPPVIVAFGLGVLRGRALLWRQGMRKIT